METDLSGDAVEAVRDLRLARGETLEQFGAAIGVLSKGRMSEIERGLRGCTPEQALAIERISGGTINAGDLNAIIADARYQPVSPVAEPLAAAGGAEAGEALTGLPGGGA